MIDTETLNALKEAAVSAAKNAYCPYSRFTVGAAVLTDDGTVFSGCNVENASFGLTICAERTAVFKAVSEGRDRIRLLVVYTPTEHPTAPCGACRQVLAEFQEEAEVVMICASGEERRMRFDELLPHSFGKGDVEAGFTRGII